MINELTRARPTHAYVGRCEGCGNVLASRADQRDKETGRAVAEMIAAALIVERVPLCDVRMGDCICPKVVQDSF